MLMHTHIVSAARYYSQGASTAAAAYQLHLRRVRPAFVSKADFYFISFRIPLLLAVLTLRRSDRSWAEKKKTLPGKLKSWHERDQDPVTAFSGLIESVKKISSASK